MPHEIPSSRCPGLFISPVRQVDIEDSITLLREFAHHEKYDLPNGSIAQTLIEDLEHETPRFLGMIARRGPDAAGIAFAYVTYSTFSASKRLFIEDLFVRPRFRGAGVGRALLSALMCRGARMDYIGMHWRVAKSNLEGQHFYRSIGAVITDNHFDCEFRINRDSL